MTILYSYVEIESSPPNLLHTWLTGLLRYSLNETKRTLSTSRGSGGPVWANVDNKATCDCMGTAWGVHVNLNRGIFTLRKPSSASVVFGSPRVRPDSVTVSCDKRNRSFLWTRSSYAKGRQRGGGQNEEDVGKLRPNK